MKQISRALTRLNLFIQNKMPKMVIDLEKNNLINLIKNL